MRPAILLLMTVILFGCGSSTVTTRVTVTERPDSLVIKGDSISFQAKSDSLLVDSVRAFPSEIRPMGPLRPILLYRSVHAKKDTTVGRWKLSFAYEYPPDRWTIQILEADTTARWKVHDSLIEKPYEVEMIPWWMTVLVVMLCAALIISLVKR